MSVSGLSGSCAKPFAQTHENGRCRAPDIVTLIGESIELAPVALPFAGVSLAVRGIEQEGERDLEDFRDFLRIGKRRKPPGQKPDDREDGEAGARLVGVEKSGNRNKACGYPGLLMRLAQSGVRER